MKIINNISHHLVTVHRCFLLLVMCVLPLEWKENQHRFCWNLYMRVSDYHFFLFFNVILLYIILYESYALEHLMFVYVSLIRHPATMRDTGFYSYFSVMFAKWKCKDYKNYGLKKVKYHLESQDWTKLHK